MASVGGGAWQKDEQGVYKTPPVTVSAVFIITKIVSKNWTRMMVFKVLSVYVACRDGQINFTT